MRVRIVIGRRAMRGPAGVAEAERPVKRALLEQEVEAFINFAALLVQVEPAAIQHGDPGAIIDAIFEPPQPFQYDRASLPLSDVTNDSAHILIISAGRGER